MGIIGDLAFFITIIPILISKKKKIFFRSHLEPHSNQHLGPAGGGFSFCLPFRDDTPVSRQPKASSQHSLRKSVSKYPLKVPPPGGHLLQKPHQPKWDRGATKAIRAAQRSQNSPSLNAREQRFSSKLRTLTGCGSPPTHTHTHSAFQSTSLRKAIRCQSGLDRRVRLQDGTTTAGVWAGQLPAWGDLDGTSAVAGWCCPEQDWHTTSVSRDMQSSCSSASGTTSQQGGTAPVLLHHDNSHHSVQEDFERHRKERYAVLR